jgi:NAD(P)-dependent dehydrogenase (short-subunit alcohol dehydrogenase family)
VSRGPEAAEAAAQEITAATRSEVRVFTGDTGKDGIVVELGAFLRATFGRADILVNCAAEPAGQGVDPTVEQVSYSQLERQMNVKVMGYLRAAQAVIPLMREGGFGRIISISGMGARKAGDAVGSIRNISVVALGKNIAEDLQGTGITSVVLHPGYTKTDKVEALIARRAKEEGRAEADIEAQLAGGNLSGFLPTPADVGAIAAFVASPLSRAINGDVIACAGGAKTAIYI